MVEIFDHILFLAVSQFNNISVWELVWVVLQSFIDASGLNPIQLGNIPIEDNLRISNDDYFVLCFAMSSFCPISLKFDFGCKDNKISGKPTNTMKTPPSASDHVGGMGGDVCEPPNPQKD